MAKLEQLKTDLEKRESGVWCPFRLGIEFKIASLENKNYVKARQNLFKQNRNLVSRDIDVDEISSMLIPIYARYILLDWRNITDENGVEIKYSIEKAIEILCNPEFVEVKDFIVERANNEALYRKYEEEVDRKNS